MPRPLTVRDAVLYDVIQSGEKGGSTCGNRLYTETPQGFLPETRLTDDFGAHYSDGRYEALLALKRRTKSWLS